MTKDEGAAAESDCDEPMIFNGRAFEAEYEEEAIKGVSHAIRYALSLLLSTLILILASR